MEEKATESVNLETVYSFVFGRSIYTVRLSDIKKATLLEHVFSDKKDDKEEVVKTLYILPLVGEQIPGVSDDNGKPIYETVMEIKAEENDYASLYRIYENLIIKWDLYRQKNPKA